MTSSHAIRVLHLDSERPWRGGERQVIELMRRQRARGDDPHLGAPGKGALAGRARAEGFPVHEVGMVGTWDVGSVIAVAKLHRALGPDVVHWHAARAHALGAMAALLAPGPVRILSRRVDFPVRRSPGSRLLYSLPIDAIVAISDGVRDALIGSGVTPGRIRVVTSGIDLAPFELPFDREALRSRLGLVVNDFLVLHTAALAPHKSQIDLLRAVAGARQRNPGIQLWIAGEGPLRSRLEAEHRALGLGDSVRFLGFIDDVSDLLRAADLFCLSSVSEGLGTSILDAMAAGLPVVATRVGGIPEIVLDGHSGILVPPRDPGSIADALIALAEDPARRSSMGAAGREHVRAYSADFTEARTRQVYLAAMDRLD